MDKDLVNLRRRVNRARVFGVTTCAASRHLHSIAEDLIFYGTSLELEESPEFCAESMLSVLESLWKMRAKHG